jgi:hypothetical protein
MPTQLREDLVKVLVVSGNQSQSPQQTQSFLSADTDIGPTHCDLF